jgi:hypothetical protein
VQHERTIVRINSNAFGALVLHRIRDTHPREPGGAPRMRRLLQAAARLRN